MTNLIPLRFSVGNPYRPPLLDTETTGVTEFDVYSTQMIVFDTITFRPLFNTFKACQVDRLL